MPKVEDDDLRKDLEKSLKKMPFFLNYKEGLHFQAYEDMEKLNIHMDKHCLLQESMLWFEWKKLQTE